MINLTIPDVINCLEYFLTSDGLHSPQKNCNDYYNNIN